MPLFVAEYLSTGGTANHNVMGPLEPPIAEQVVGIGGVSAAIANPFSVQTNYVRIHTDTTCSIAFGVNPTATTNNKRLCANQTEYFSVPPGSNFKVAVIANS